MARAYIRVIVHTIYSSAADDTRRRRRSSETRSRGTAAGAEGFSHLNKTISPRRRLPLRRPKICTRFSRLLPLARSSSLLYYRIPFRRRSLYNYSRRRGGEAKVLFFFFFVPFNTNNAQPPDTPDEQSCNTAKLFKSQLKKIKVVHDLKRKIAR